MTISPGRRPRPIRASHGQRIPKAVRMTPPAMRSLRKSIVISPQAALRAFGFTYTSALPRSTGGLGRVEAVNDLQLQQMSRLLLFLSDHSPDEAGPGAAGAALRPQLPQGKG